MSQRNCMLLFQLLDFRPIIVPVWHGKLVLHAWQDKFSFCISKDTPCVHHYENTIYRIYIFILLTRSYFSTLALCYSTPPALLLNLTRSGRTLPEVQCSSTTNIGSEIVVRTLLLLSIIFDLSRCQCDKHSFIQDIIVNVTSPWPSGLVLE